MGILIREKIPFKRMAGYIEFINPRDGKKDWIIDSGDVVTILKRKGYVLLVLKNRQTKECYIR